MAVIGIGTTSRATVEDVLAIVQAAAGKVHPILMEPTIFQAPPHPNPLPEGRGSPAFICELRADVPSPQGEKDRMRGDFSHLHTSTPISSVGQPQAQPAPLLVLASLDRPANNPVLCEAASEAGFELILLSLEELEAVAALCTTHSEKSMKQYGIPSVAEAAALAAAGPSARLLLPRFCGRNTTASVAV